MTSKIHILITVHGNPAVITEQQRCKSDIWASACQINLYCIWTSTGDAHVSTQESHLAQFGRAISIENSIPAICRQKQHQMSLASQPQTGDSGAYANVLTAFIPNSTPESGNSTLKQEYRQPWKLPLWVTSALLTWKPCYKIHCMG